MNAPATEFQSEIGALLRECPPIVCFANDWQGDPTSKHHIMRILAGHVPVLWVESAGMRTPDFARLSDVRRMLHRLRRASLPNRPDDDGGVRVISPLSLPLPGNRAAERLNARLYRRAVQRALGEAPVPPVLWVYTPTVAPYLRDLPHSAIVYHCVDRWWAFSDYDEALMRRHHETLCRSADLVFASAAELLEDCRPHAPDAQLLRHGVDWPHFAAAAFDAPARPQEIADLDTPIIGFFGLLHDWIDQDLLVRVARSQPDATLLLIGKADVDIGRLLAEPNVRWVGQQPYARLPAFTAAFDVALIPFRVNELTAAVNPIKLREYLAAGVPVVATALPEIAAIDDCDELHVAASADDFVTGVSRVLAQPATAERRRALADSRRIDSWEGRCLLLAREVAGVLGTGGALR